MSISKIMIEKIIKMNNKRICPICNERDIPEQIGSGRPRNHCKECNQTYKKQTYKKKKLEWWRKRYDSDPEFRKKHQEASRISHNKYHWNNREKDNERNRMIRIHKLKHYRKMEFRRKRKSAMIKSRNRTPSQQRVADMMKSPKGEGIMKQILNKIYPDEIKTDNKSFIIINGKLRQCWRAKKGACELDRFYPKLRLAFEYHGEFHYKYIEFFHRNRSLEYIQHKDKETKEMCDTVGIRLIVIIKNQLDEDIIKNLINFV